MIKQIYLKEIFIISVYIYLTIQVTESNISANENVVKDKSKSHDSGLLFVEGPSDPTSAIEGSGGGSNSNNEIKSDDEDDDDAAAGGGGGGDDLPGLIKPNSDKKISVNANSDIDFSGDGPIDRGTDTEEGGDDEDPDGDEGEDDEDDEGSGDLIHSSKDNHENTDSRHSNNKETITDDETFKFTPNKPSPDLTNYIPDSSEDKDIIVDTGKASSTNNIPGIIETSTKFNSPNINRDRDNGPNNYDGNTLRNDISILGRKQDARPVSFFAQPGILAAVIGGTVASLLCAILLAMFIIYRMRKKDEGSYKCEPSKLSPPINHYGKGSSKQFYDP